MGLELVAGYLAMWALRKAGQAGNRLDSEIDRPSTPAWIGCTRWWPTSWQAIVAWCGWSGMRPEASMTRTPASGYKPW
jgi:hypothetical protein